MTESSIQPRKVLMTADTAGGVWTYALELARGLGERGVDVALAALGAPVDEQQRERAERIPGVRVFEGHFKLEWMDDPWRDIEKAGEWLLNLERRICPDVVHLNNFVHGALDWNAPTLVVGHSCMLSRWQAVKREPVPESWDRYREEVAAGLAAADLVVAPSAAMLATLAEHYGPLHTGRVIPNGRDASLFRPAAKEGIVFSTGSLWDEATNLQALEAAAPQIPWPVFVAGDSRQPGCSEIRPHNTRLLGRLSQRALAVWLGRSSIYALPALYEPIGLTVLEAALSACALVLGDIPSLRETWRNRAVFVPPDDPEALAHELRSLIEQPDRRQSLAAGAHQRALEYTPERMVDGYLEAYAQLLAGREQAFAAEAYPQRVAV